MSWYLNSGGEAMEETLTCPDCGEEFCLGCAKQTNMVDQIRVVADFALCPNCGADYFWF
jgi:ribosomal protein S27AE